MMKPTLRNKMVPLTDAVGRVRDGDQVVMSAGMERTPMAILREMVRQGRKELRLAGVVGGALNLDFLCGAGLAAAVDTCSVTLGTFARTGPNFKRMVEEGRLRPLDNT